MALEEIPGNILEEGIRFSVTNFLLKTGDWLHIGEGHALELFDHRILTKAKYGEVVCIKPTIIDLSVKKSNLIYVRDRHCVTSIKNRVCSTEIESSI